MKLRRLSVVSLSKTLALLLLLPILASADRPNIVIIVVDDAGLMDFGGYGGEARTPSINAIADAGVRFTNYHSSPLCSPSRAMLLTGMDNHQTGIGTIPEVLTEEQAKHPGYSMRLNDNVDTIADRLKSNGYRTYMTGKWHLGSGEGDLPNSHGFDRSFALDASGADNWEQKSYVPYYETAPWFEDGQPATLPADFYSSKFIVDKMLEYLSGGDSTAPFLAYLAFQAVHIPVQAPREFIDNYAGVYSDGWDALLTRRYERAKELGIIPADAKPPQMLAPMRSWQSLTPEEMAWFERVMMIHAGMLEAMDAHIGRLVDFLKSNDQFRNTIFIITSDNGPEFLLPNADPFMQLWMLMNDYQDDLETLGGKGSLASIGPEWASATAAPGRLFKFYAANGGTRVPLIVSGPGISRQGFNPAFTFVTDITPTLLEITRTRDTSRLPMTGVSILGQLRGDTRSAHMQPVGLEVSGSSALYSGDHKLVLNALPHGDATWRLYNLVEDPGETTDLSQAEPALFSRMRSDYEAFAERVGVVPSDPDITKRLSRNVAGAWLSHNQELAGGVLLGLVLLIGLPIVLLLRRLFSSGNSRKMAG